MSAKRPEFDFAQLARLQELAALESRRTVEGAVAETDRRELACTQAAHDLARADAAYSDFHAAGPLCPVRLQVVGAILAGAVETHVAESAALDTARSAETEAGEAWLRDEHRVDWFAERARKQARRRQRERDARAEETVRALKLALPGQPRR